MQRLAQLLAGGYLALAALITALTLITGPLGYAPITLPIGPAREPIVVSIAYSSEKQTWLEEAARRFTAENRRIRGRLIHIELQRVGSREMVSRIVAGTLEPVAISPASTSEIERLRVEWQGRNRTSILLEGADAPQPLVLTPLVLVMWQERAQALWPNGPSSDFWGKLHDALADPQGWAARGHAEWGFVKFGHTSPLTSSSGMQTLVLLAADYHNKASGLSSQDLRDPGFQQWLGEIEQSMTQFDDSTAALMDTMVRFGPSRYDVVAVYENLAIQNIAAAQGRWNQPLQIYYPPATIVSDHPYATLSAPWVTPEQREAAALFRAYLLAEPAQTLALQSGFRPTNPQVALSSDDPANPFSTFASYGGQIDIQQQVEPPPPEVLTELTELWRSTRGR